MFYGGKGGVGKTTCAAARSVAEARAGRRVLALSTDPAHSLGDAFGRRLSPRPRRVARRLDAAELDAPRAFARWLVAHRDALADVVEHGTWLDRRDVDMLLDLPVPGVDELVGLLEIVRVSRLGYDVVIVDTAPTGHALRLMAAPAAVAAIADVLDSLQEEHRIVRRQLARVGGAEAADRLIALIARQASDTSALLRHSSETAFAWVTLPEQLSLAESAAGIAALSQLGIRVTELIVNRLTADAVGCPICRARAAEERSMLASARRSFGGRRTLRVVPAFGKEPRGIRSLEVVGQFLTGERILPAVAARRGSRARAKSMWISGGGEGGPETIRPVREAHLIFVGGKGGVGKTTVAAALALRLAAARPAQSILLLSTDPAHSLSDVLGTSIGHQAGTVARAPANLRAMELDAVSAFRASRAAFEAAFAEIGRRPQLAGYAHRPLDVAASRLIELAPPGIDELFAMLSVLDASSTYDVIVVDTAPTGHALRLLALPETARAWIQALLRLLLKYRELARPGRLAAELVDGSRAIRRLQSALRDPTATRFIVVTRAASIPRAETDRLLRRLRVLRIAPGAILVNARTLAPGACRRCQATARAERREVRALRPPRGCAIIQTPLAVPPPRGTAALNRWARSWTA